jgi:methyl-accepting chemotaxis protein
MADVDPTGAIANAAREVGELIEKDLGSVSATFFTTYMRETGLQDRLGGAIIARIEQEADRYVREKLLHFAEGRWAQSAADCVRHARKHDVSLPLRTSA